MTIYERVKAALESLGVPLAAQRFADTGALPDLFLVYFLIVAVGEQFADDAETARSNNVQVSIYSRTGLVDIPNVDGAMLAAGFTRGPARDLPFNTVTGHYGLALEYTYLAEE